MYRLIDDTIVAVSSGTGRAIRGIVRLSGPAAIEIAARLFVADGAAPLSQLRGFAHISGKLHLSDRCRVPAEVYLFRAPRSYTRQDCVELHTIGAPPLLAMVLEAAQAAGARLAEPGEFTARAFLSGAMDLTRAEAVAATIRARTDTQLRAASQMRDGDLHRRIVRWRNALAELLALVEADIDFAEEPIEFITPGELRDRLGRLLEQIETLWTESASTERFDVLPAILLIGRPNAGKSSLLNALSGMDRAICSAVSGTTRDVLSAPITVGSIDAILLDAAGLSEDADALTQRARKLALAAAERVDVLGLVVDVAGEVDAGVFDCIRSASATPCVLIVNKIDLADEATLRRCETVLRAAAPASVVAYCEVSAAVGTGLDRLRSVLAEQLGNRDDLGEEKAILLSSRQRRCLESAAAALDRARAEAAKIGETLDRAEVLALELREAVDALGEVAGEVTTDDLLATVFASFCIGK